MHQKRLLVLGFDSMDVELVRRWAAAGYLPTFRRLFESAAWTHYVDPTEHLTGTIWTSIHTGLDPLRHNFYFFRRFCGGSYRIRMARAGDLRSDTFWEWFARSGRRIVVVDVPFLVPRSVYGGKQLAGWGLHDPPLKRSSVPRGLLGRLSAQFGAHPVPYCHNYTTQTTSLLRLRSGLLTGIERRTAMLKSLLLCRDWDLFYGVYSEPHCAGHLMWHLEDDTHSRHSSEQLAEVGHALRDIYVAIDRALGELLECTDADTTCAVFFSHGMGPNYHGEHLFARFVARFNRWWEGEDTEMERTENMPGLFDCVWRSSVGKVPAAWRARLKQLLPLLLRAWISTKRQQSPKLWSRRPAFALPFDVISSLRVNLSGREPRGRIRPGEEYRRYLDAFTAELLQLTNVETGGPAVERIFRADQRIDPVALGSGPDLLVWWSKSGPIRVIQSPTLGTISGEFADDHTGEHATRAMLLISHPQARRGCHTIAGMKGVDIPATLCELAGIQPGSVLDGVSRCRNFLAE